MHAFFFKKFIQAKEIMIELRIQKMKYIIKYVTQPTILYYPIF